MTSFRFDNIITIFFSCKSRPYSNDNRCIINFCIYIFLSHYSINDNIWFILFRNISIFINNYSNFILCDNFLCLLIITYQLSFYTFYIYFIFIDNIRIRHCQSHSQWLFYLRHNNRKSCSL